MRWRPPAGARTRAGDSTSVWSSTALALLCIFAIAVILRAVAAWSIPARNDEIYHFLAARSWIHGDGLTIADGIYGRARLFTMLVAAAMTSFGETLQAARVPSILCGSLTAVGLFLWTRRHCGIPDAWIAAMLFATAMLSVTIGAFARFYALHALLFWGFAAAVYAFAARPDGRAQQVGLAAGLPALGLAIHLQVITLIGVGALGLWLLVDALQPGWLRDRLGTARVRLLVAAIAGFGVLLLIGAAAAGLLTPLLERFLESPAWTQHARHQLAYYYRFFVQEYPALFALLPLVIAAALARAPRPALFCTVMLLMPLGVLSLAGMKYPTYVYWLLPPLFVLFGLAIAALAAPAGTLGRRAAERLLAHPAPAWIAPATVIATLLLLVVASIGLYATPLAVVRTLRAEDSLGHGAAWQARFVEWEPAWTPERPRLLALMKAADITVTTDELRTLLYIGRPDVLLNASRMTEIRDRREFGRDQRTGLPVIAAPESLDLLLRCNRSGLLLRAKGGEREGRIPRATDALMAARLQELPAPAGVPGLRLLGWRHGPAWMPAANCPELAPLWKRP